MRRAILAAAIVLAGCSSSPELPPIDSPDVKAAQDAWFSCLRTAAKRDDDGRSDAGTIAVAVKGECSPLYLRWLRVTGLYDLNERVRLHNPMIAAQTDQKADQHQLQIATSAVLRSRRGE